MLVIGKKIGVKIQSQTIRSVGFLPRRGGTNNVDIVNVIIIPIQAIVKSLE